MIDTRLPMAVQTPNILGAMAQGTQLAGAQAGLMRQAEGQNLFRQHGADAMQGQQGALNALAGFDPAMAQGIDTTRRENQRADRRLSMSEEQLGMAREEAKRAAEQHAATMSAAERQREAAAIERGLMQMAPLIDQARQTGDVTALNQALRTFGMEPVADADAAMLLAAQYSGVAEVLKGADELRGGAVEPRTQAAKLKADFDAGLIDEATYQAALTKLTSSDGMALEVGPDGTMRMAQGGAAQVFKFTEAQSKDNVYATRAEGALALLDSVGAEALSGRGDRMLDAVPLGLGREMQGETFQVAQQAGEEFLQAILRKDTGAAITAQEQDLYGKTYLPQPGDGPRVIEAKRQARIRAIEALKSGMNIQQLTVSERALIQAAERAGGNPGGGSNDAAPDVRTMPIDQLPTIDFSTLSDEELKIAIERMSQQ